MTVAFLVNGLTGGRFALGFGQTLLGSRQLLCVTVYKKGGLAVQDALLESWAHRRQR